MPLQRTVVHLNLGTGGLPWEGEWSVREPGQGEAGEAWLAPQEGMRGSKQG